MKWTTDVFSDTKNQISGAPWESFNNGQLLVYTPPNCKASTKIAAYDMDFTLIKPKSGEVHATSADDWEFAFSTIGETIKSEHSNDFKIVIFTNQAGVQSGITDLSDIKQKIENIIEALGVPVQAFVATGLNFFRKPLTGMWQVLCDHKNDGVAIEVNQSYFVGNAAGRLENRAINQEKDHSLVDRLMAFNVGLKFFTPEEHFLNVAPQAWQRPEFNPKDFLSRPIKLIAEHCLSPNCSGKSDSGPESDPKGDIVIDDETQLMLMDKSEIIVMVGAPGAGNSFSPSIE